MMTFTAEIAIIGINPYVFVPEEILQELFKKASKNKGHIPVKGTINGTAYKQTLVKYSGAWRLYINTVMLKNSPKRIGEQVELSVDYDPEPRVIKPPAEFIQALKENPEAKTVFEKLSASRQLEIVRYLSHLKSAQSLERNIVRAINFLTSKEKFVGRKKP